ncbi:MAG: chromate transporter [Beduini sp.]|uniref:chromate transporter n=1 Tax=Beduini sp. TaxID=1922300 RepID=UPI0039A35F5A
MILLQLFIEFFKVGLFSIGGGLATLPFLYHLSDTMQWFTHADIVNMIAIAESTPGAIGINMSTYAGFTTAGFFGAVIASIGLAAPSVIIILVIANLLKKFKENKHVQSAFLGLRPASLAMIAAAGISVVKVSLVNIPAFEQTGQVLDLFVLPAILLGVVLYILSKKTKWNPIVLIALSAAAGIIFQFAGA